MSARDTRNEVDGPRPIGSHTDAGTPGGAGIAKGHEGGPLLVPGPDEVDVRAAVQRVEHLDVARADDPECMGHSFGAQGFDDRFTSPHLDHGAHSFFRFGERLNDAKRPK